MDREPRVDSKYDNYLHAQEIRKPSKIHYLTIPIQFSIIFLLSLVYDWSFPFIH